MKVYKRPFFYLKKIGSRVAGVLHDTFDDLLLDGGKLLKFDSSGGLTDLHSIGDDGSGNLRVFAKESGSDLDLHADTSVNLGPGGANAYQADIYRMMPLSAGKNLGHITAAYWWYQAYIQHLHLKIEVITDDNHTYDTGDTTLVGTGLTGNKTFTLPLNPKNGDIYTIKAGVLGGNNLVLDGNGKNIDGAPTQTLNVNYTFITVQFDETADEWFIISN